MNRRESSKKACRKERCATALCRRLFTGRLLREDARPVPAHGNREQGGPQLLPGAVFDYPRGSGHGPELRDCPGCLGGTDRPDPGHPLGMGGNRWLFAHRSDGNAPGGSVWLFGRYAPEQSQRPGDDHRYGHGLFRQRPLPVRVPVFGGHPDSL